MYACIKHSVYISILLVCRYVFTSSADENRHNLLMHGGKRSIDRYVFTSSADENRHNLLMHGGKRSIDRYEIGAFKFCCKVCHHAFPTSYQLVKHRKELSNKLEREDAASRCPSAFMPAWGEGPSTYAASRCPSAFMPAWGEDPSTYAASRCPSAFMPAWGEDPSTYAASRCPSAFMPAWGEGPTPYAASRCPFACTPAWGEGPTPYAASRCPSACMPAWGEGPSPMLPLGLRLPSCLPGEKVPPLRRESQQRRKPRRKDRC